MRSWRNKALTTDLYGETEEKYGKLPSGQQWSPIRDYNPKTKHDVRQDVNTPVDPSGNYMYHQVYRYILHPPPCI